MAAMILAGPGGAIAQTGPAEEYRFVTKWGGFGSGGFSPQRVLILLLGLL